MPAIREFLDRTEGKVKDTHIFEGHILVSTPDMLEMHLQRQAQFEIEERKLIEEHRDATEQIEG